MSSAGGTARPSPALLVDLYELTMMQAYREHGVGGRATFDLFVRRLPRQRSFLLVAGLGTVLQYLEESRFGPDDLEYLSSTGHFSDDFLSWLGKLRFSGDIDAVPEGTVVFGGEPLLRVTAPIAEAQLLETLLMNQVHLQTLLASKAARVVLAAEGHGLVDFGLRRTHGIDAGLCGARAFWIAGFDATSNLLAGKLLGMPVAGTMAHSFVQCHESELQAFRRFVETFPETILLVDTYDTDRGVERVVELTRQLGEQLRIRGIRLDSGDLAALARQARQRLDQAGLGRLSIFASGNLDEWSIRELIASGAPIDAFGVGTHLSTSQDAPNLDIVYKLAQLDRRPLLKLSAGKSTLPGIKQVWREIGSDGTWQRDIIGLADEDRSGSGGNGLQPLLEPVMRQGKRIGPGREELGVARVRAATQLTGLPPALRSLEPADQPFPVELSAGLAALRDRVATEMRR